MNWTRIWGVNRLTALIRNPYTLFVYWEVSPQSKELVSRHFSASWESLPQFLRINDVTGLPFNGENAGWNRFTQTSDRADCEYVGDLSPGRTYVADLGLLMASGEFFTLLRSQPVQTPPDASLRTSDRPSFARLGQAAPETLGWHRAARGSGTIPGEWQFDGYSAIERRGP